MTIREGIACLVAAACVLLAVGFYRRAAESERAAGEMKQDLTRKIKDLQGQMKAAVARAAETPPPARSEEIPLQTAIAEKPAEEIAEAAPVPAPVAAAASAPAPTVSPERAKAIMDSPSMKLMQRKATRTNAQRMYGDLLTSWGLQGDARQMMLDAIIERDQAKAQGVAEAVKGDPLDAARRMQEAGRQADDNLARQLTPAQVAELKEYEQGTSDRLVRKEIEREVSELDIDPSRVGTIRDIIVAERRLQSQEMYKGLVTEQDAADLAAGVISQQDLAIKSTEAMLKNKRASNERILQQARPMLTEAEFGRLQEQCDAGASGFEMSLQFLAAAKEGAAAK